jgi:hypothetical protein
VPNGLGCAQLITPASPRRSPRAKRSIRRANQPDRCSSARPAAVSYRPEAGDD